MSAKQESITPTQLADALQRDEPPLLLDVRSAWEFRGASIADAVSLPLHKLDALAFVQEHGAQKPCVVMCRCGHRASLAAAQLIAAGMNDVRVLEGGMLAWEEVGLPVRRSARPMMSLERQARIANGLWILLGWALGTWLHPAWFALCAFMGASLIFSGLADYCGHARILAKMAWNKSEHRDDTSS